MDWTNKNIWITGAGSGIGAALAVAVSERGARVIITSRRTEALEKVAGACHDRATVIPGDMADSDHLAELVTQVRAQVTTIDGLILCAGVSQRSTGLETNLAVTRHLFAVNALAPIVLTRLVAPEMIARKEGLIVPVSSLAGKAGFPLRSTYSATKHALHGYFEAFRAECAEHEVQVTIAVPGFVATDISKNAVLGDGAIYGRMDENQENAISAEACARQIVAGIERGALEVRTGMGFRGILALLLHTIAPRLFARKIRTVRPT